MNTAKQVAFFGRSKEPEPARELLAAAGELAAGGAEVFFADELAEHCGRKALANSGAAVLPEKEICHANLAFALGGDGTFLRTARHCAPLGIPLAGINLGTLGFLTDVSRGGMRGEIMEICRGQRRMEKRFMLSAQVERDGKVLPEPGEACALNDMVVSRGEAGLLVEIRVCINQVFVYNLRADGLILATPSGSTAYALAAGGPIITPDLRAVLLAPLCAHALTHRPLAVNSVRAEITLEITKSRRARLHADGQIGVSLASGDVVRVRRHKKSLTICHPLSYDYYNTLRKKLSWGS
ncbi:MAG: NAD(+)/NADH kinase [Gammaproteobacteria bacterium]